MVLKFIAGTCSRIKDLSTPLAIGCKRQQNMSLAVYYAGATHFLSLSYLKPSLSNDFFNDKSQVDQMSPVWPPAPSKVSLSEKLSMILGVFRCFFGQNKFSRPKGPLCLEHVIHILKAIVPAVNFSY